MYMYIYNVHMYIHIYIYIEREREREREREGGSLKSLSRSAGRDCRKRKESKNNKQQYLHSTKY